MGSPIFSYDAGSAPSSGHREEPMIILVTSSRIIFFVALALSIAYWRSVDTQANNTYPTQARGNISGQVVLPSGHQVSTRIRITLSGYRLSPSVTFTDNKGRFSFSNISDGTYSIEVTADSNRYETVTQEVRVIYGASPALL